MLPGLLRRRRGRTFSAAGPAPSRDGPPPARPEAPPLQVARVGAAARVVPYRTVLVDDAENFRNLLRIILRRDGRFEVVGEAGDGKRGIEVVRDAQPDLVLLDLTMPVMDGVAALPRMREASPSSKVVVLSGVDRASIEPRTRSLGAAGFIQKGGRPHELLADILRALGEP